MEKYQPMAMPKPMSAQMPSYTPMSAQMPSYAPMPNVGPAPTAVSPVAMPQPIYHAPINVHASYEEINIYAPKKHHHHWHGHGFTSAALILVLYILLVIVLRSMHRI
ncbi:MULTISPECIES: sporulation protein YjcZ [unclassified Paenibacillus]|uniref:sporulation protein YjcZ n=1 Tax=unclassified Paenibacillus TaxID=185978 RepID=UPI001AE64CBD|nr:MULTISPECIES: sporulation protein YjcZ [unclassified Paenibacillus]MBP1157140.1 uncharacterized protein (TIGR01732 family) [Paenibacillus sp. PvP091]MBP1172121.1 uncharacterized protein (TIGR01732 family) [Paenibacillus sp. PvR098]MBP2438502.1 uncharacterized protein (TIGR01732 family) [Paenibacillus sp. PvP052]